MNKGEVVNMNYAIFLRGINTGKRKLLKDDFITLLEMCHFTNIITIGAAGTAVVSIDHHREIHTYITCLSQALKDFFKTPIEIFYKDKHQIMQIIQSTKNQDIPPFIQCYAIIHKDNTLFKKAKEAHFNIPYLEGEKLIEGDGYFIWHVPKGHTLDSFGKIILGKKPFKEHLTSRSINTIQRVLKHM